MTTQIRDAVLSFYETVDTRAPHDVVALFSPTAVYRRPGYEPMRGAAELLAFYGGGRVIDAGAHTIETVVVDGDRAAVQGRFDGVLRDGQQIRLRFADFFCFEAGGLVAERDTYFDAPAV
jgi:ketosteroid isomerase-like protein